MNSWMNDIFLEYKSVKRQNRAFGVIHKYIKSPEEIFPPLCKMGEEDLSVVWQFWEWPANREVAGIKLVSFCLDSVEKYIWDGFERKLLSLESSEEYVRFPDYVYDKLREGKFGFGMAAFSDLLRLALLCRYGGIWADSTILALRPLQETYLFNRDEVGFSFGRSDQESRQVRREWRRYGPYFSWSRFSRVKWLSSLIVSGKNRELLREILRVLLLIWKYEQKYPHYFTIQIVYDYFVCRQGRDGFLCESDVPVHYMQKYANVGYDENFFAELRDKYPLQKLSWKMDISSLSRDSLLRRLMKKNGFT